MKVNLTSTTKIVEAAARGGSSVKARVWEGTTESGCPVVAVICSIAHKADAKPEDVKQFELDLKEHAPPGQMAKAYDFRFFLD